MAETWKKRKMELWAMGEGEPFYTEVDPNRGLESYCRIVENIRRQAGMQLQGYAFERAYICLVRLVTLVTQAIPQHPEYTSSSFRAERKRLKLTLQNAVDILEKINAKFELTFPLPEEAPPIEEEPDDEPKENIMDVVETKEESDAVPASLPPTAPIAGELEIPGHVPAWKPTVLDQQRVSIPLDLMERFLHIASNNTARDVETCGILTGVFDTSAKMYRITTKGTANTVVTYEEEKIMDVQFERGLITLGWIHTHPSQSCFLSSIDLHTHFGYQVMLSEAIAIVMAPSKTKDSGIFSITKQGMSVLSTCPKRGFHAHTEGEGLYGEAKHAFLDESASPLEIIKL